VAKLKLVLKGADRTANSAATIENFERNGLNGTVFRSLFDTGAIEYIGDQLDSKGVAALIKASDTYASSYKAEGFCLPVLEAMAVGVPVIATAQGPTDEFTKPEFAKRIPAKQVELIDPDTHSGFDRAWMLEPSVDSIYETMLEAMIDVKWREAAAVSAANFVHEEKRGYSIEAITKRLLAVMFEKPEAPKPKAPKKQEMKKPRGEELEL
jgi:glycosyltransferase involved in cell wall biosynthesis